LQGVESVTGENVAGAIIDYVKENYKKGNKFNMQLRDYQEKSTTQLIAETRTELDYIFKTCKTKSEISTELQKLEKEVSPEIISRTLDAMGKVGTERNTYHSIF